MAGAFRKRYLRLVRHAYRFLRSPKFRRYPWLQRILSPIFDRELWHPCRDTVSHGLAIGFFVSMLPIPGQMILAAIGAVRFRANVAIAIASCWITNPITQIPIMVFQEKFGDFLKETLHIPVHPILGKFNFILPAVGELNAGSFILGFLSLAFLLMLTAYPLTYLISALVPKALPKTRYQRAKAKVLKRKESKQSS